MIDVNLFKNSLKAIAINNKSELDFSKRFSDLYDTSIKTGTDQYGNAVLNTNKNIIENGFNSMLMSLKVNKDIKSSVSKFSIAIMGYWATATMSIIFQVPSTIICSSNIITIPGIPGVLIFSKYDNIDIFVSNITNYIFNHLLTIQGINYSIVSTPTGPIVVPFSWFGIK